MAEASGLMRGKRGLILGVANNRSLAWGIARACRTQGADVAFTYQGDALKKRVEPLAQEIGAQVFGHCDVSDPASIDAVFATAQKTWGKLDFVVHAIAFSDKKELDGRYVDTSPDNFSKTMSISCYSFVAVAPARREDDAGRRLAADADLLRRREMDSALQRHGRRQGGAGDVGSLSRRRPRHQEDPRQRHLVGTDQDTGGLGHRRLPLHPRMDRAQCAAAAHGDHDEVGDAAVYLLSDMSRGVTAEVLHVDAGYNIVGMKHPDAPDIDITVPKG
jgi:enoyl-[acyl-carrier protein] reductase I